MLATTNPDFLHYFNRSGKFSRNSETGTLFAFHCVVQDYPYGDKLMITRRNALNTLAAAALAVGLGASAMTATSPALAAEDTIKVGVLHSLSGTMAISETTLGVVGYVL